MFESRDHVRRFVATLRIPDSRKTLVEAELLDHIECRASAALAAGGERTDAERTALEALGDPEVLRASLERIEPAFELDPTRVTLRGLVAAFAASAVFAALGMLFRLEGTHLPQIVLGLVFAPVGALVLSLLSPLGIGAALVAEARATVQPRVPQTQRRRAVKGYMLSIVVVFHGAWLAWGLMGLPERMRDDVLMSWGMLGIVHGVWGLAILRRARRDLASST